MVQWGKHPEFTPSTSTFRKRLDIAILVVGVAVTLYNSAYVGLGLYYGEIDHEKEKLNLRKLDDRVNKMIYGKSMEEMSPAFRTLHESISIVDMAARIRESQEKEVTSSSNNSSSTNGETTSQTRD